MMTTLFFYLAMKCTRWIIIHEAYEYHRIVRIYGVDPIYRSYKYTWLVSVTVRIRHFKDSVYYSKTEISKNRNFANDMYKDVGLQ